MKLGLLLRLADIVALPLFLIGVLYFWRKPRKTTVEWLMFVFMFGGLVVDTVFTVDFIWSG